MLQVGRRGKGEEDAESRYGRESPLPGCFDGVTGTGATPAAFYLGLCRLCGNLSPPASATVILQEGRSSAQLRWCCRRNHSSLWQRLLQAELFFFAATAAAGGTIPLCRYEN